MIIIQIIIIVLQNLATNHLHDINITGIDVSVKCQHQHHSHIQLMTITIQHGIVAIRILSVSNDCYIYGSFWNRLFWNHGFIFHMKKETKMIILSNGFSYEFPHLSINASIFHKFHSMVLYCVILKDWCENTNSA